MNEEFTEAESVEIPDLEESTVIEIIHKKDLKPLFDANHDHKYIRGDEETDDYYDEVCTVKNCGMGRLIAKR